MVVASSKQSGRSERGRSQSLTARGAPVGNDLLYFSAAKGTAPACFISTLNFVTSEAEGLTRSRRTQNAQRG
jgi:hypothetical protein